MHVCTYVHIYVAKVSYQTENVVYAWAVVPVCTVSCVASQCTRILYDIKFCLASTHTHTHKHTHTNAHTHTHTHLHTPAGYQDCTIDEAEITQTMP